MVGFVRRHILVVGLIILAALWLDSDWTLAQVALAQLSSEESDEPVMPQRYGELFPQQMRFEQISLNDGLSAGSIYSIFQDSAGFMWFGSSDGLNRYDGYDFRIYKHDPDDPNSLSNNLILSIAEDDAGILWIGTFGGGLNRYDPETEQFTSYRHDPADPSSLSNDYVVRVLIDNTGIFWIATEGGGLNRFDPELEEFTRYQHDPDDPASLSHDLATRIFEDRAGVLWVGTEGGGLNRFDRRTESFTHFRHDPADPNSISHDIIWSITEGPGGELWLGTFGGGISVLDPETGDFSHLRHDPDNPASLSSDEVRFIYQDRRGEYWAGTLGAGLNRYNRESETFTRIMPDYQDAEALQDGVLFSMYEDPAGVIWIGTANAGLEKHVRSHERFAHLEPAHGGPLDLPGGVGDLFEDSAGRLWLGVGAGVLSRFDPKSGESKSGAFVHYLPDPERSDALSPTGIGAFSEDSSGVLWMGGFGGGLSALDLSDSANLNPETASFVRYHHDLEDPGSLSHDIVWATLAVGDGTVWVGTPYGLDALAPGAGSFVHYRHDADDESSISSNTVRSLFESRDGTVWVGTDVGLNRFDPDSRTFKRYTHDPADPQSLGNNIILSIFEDREGILWLGTWGGGLNQFDPAAGAFRRFTAKDGLANDTVYAIAGDESALWISTNKGVSRFDLQGETFLNYESGDGLQGNVMAEILLSQGGEILVVDEGGLTVFDPAALLDAGEPPPIVLTSLTQGGERVTSEAGDSGDVSFSLNWPANFFEFEYAALSYAKPERNQYAYILEGFDDDWIEMRNRRFGRYTNLPGGDYTLRIKGSGDGVWNEDGLALAITVVPPFWQTWWFIGAIILIAAGGAYAGYRLRLRSAAAGQRILEAEVAERTRDLNALYAVANAASRSVGLPDTLTDLLHESLEVTQSDAGGIQLLAENDELYLAEQAGLSGSLSGEDTLTEMARLSVLSIQQARPALAAEPGDSLNGEVRRGKMIAIPLVTKRGIIGALVLVTRTARNYPDAELALLASMGQQAGGAIENARLFLVEKRRAEQFQVISDVGRRIMSILDIDALLLEIVQLIQSSFGYYQVAIGLIEDEYVAYRVGAGELWRDPAFAFRPDRLRVGEQGLSGKVAATGEALIVSDVSLDPDYVEMQGSRTRSELLAPIGVKGAIIGVLDVQSNRLNAFDETDLIVIQAMAYQAGTAIENARLYEQARRLAVVEERSRLARELHDAATQSIYSLTLLAEAGKRMIASGDLAGARGNQERIGDIAQHALQEMRLLVYQLRPSELKTLGLVGALEQRLEVVERRAGIAARLVVEGEGQILPEVEEALFRVSQEALNNALKHAHATAVQVQLTLAGDSVTLIVRDDGRGFEPRTTVDKGGLGLHTMKERLEMIAGQLHVHTSPGEGTTVSACTPLAPFSTDSEAEPAHSDRPQESIT